MTYCDKEIHWTNVPLSSIYWCCRLRFLCPKHFADLIGQCQDSLLMSFPTWNHCAGRNRQKSVGGISVLDWEVCIRVCSSWHIYRDTKLFGYIYIYIYAPHTTRGLLCLFKITHSTHGSLYNLCFVKMTKFYQDLD